MEQNEKELLDRTFSRLNDKGILNYFQARYISEVANVIEKSDINCLKPYKNIYESKADEIASQIIVQFLLKNNLKLTINTANYEYANLFHIKDLSVSSSLQIPKKDSKSNLLHDLLQFWKETKDETVKLNKQKMRQEIQEKFDYIDKIDEQKRSTKESKDNYINNESTKNNKSKQEKEFLTISKLGFDSQPIFFEDDDEDFDTQIENQLLSLSSSNIINDTKLVPSDNDEIITSNDHENLSNLSIQTRNFSQPIIINKLFPKDESKITNHKQISNINNNSKRKKREIVTLIPMRSADLKGYDETKTSFITKVQTLEFLESSSSSDNFFESDVSEHNNILFDIDSKDDNENEKEIINHQKTNINHEKTTDFDDFDDL